MIGYLERISGRPGDRIGVKVSSQVHEPYAADFVRIIHADPNPAGPGMKLEPIQCAFQGDYPSRVQAVNPGSYGVIDASLAVPEGGAIQVRVQPGRLDTPQPVLALGQAVILVSQEGVTLTMGGSPVSVVAAPMLERCWYELTATFANGQVHLVQRPFQRSWGVNDSGEAGGVVALPGGERLWIAADPA
ncbi:MAG: hypothetical protein ACRYG8_42185, partial [Janthinobacterium lividum]